MISIKKSYDVVIVGAGVAGTVLARELEDRFSVALLERRNNIGKYGHRVVSQPAFEKLRVRKDKVIQSIDEVRFYSPFGRYISLQGKRGYVLNQRDIEKDIFEQLTSTDIYLGEHANSLKTDSRQVQTDKNKFCYNILVGADGAVSKLRSLLKIKPPKLIKCYTEVWYDNTSFTSFIFTQRYAPGFYGWVIPGDRCVEIGIGRGDAPNDAYGSFISEYPIFKSFKRELVKRNGGIIPLTTVNKKVVNNCILIGDAAGGEALLGATFHKAIDEAKIASETIIEFNNNNNLDLATSYENKWEAKIGEDLNNQLMMREKIDMHTDEELEEVFKKAENIQGSGLVNIPLRNLLKEL